MTRTARHLPLALLAVLLLALTAAYALRETPQQRADRARIAQAAPFCRGRTERGEPCLRRTRDVSGYCADHRPVRAEGVAVAVGR